MTGPWEVPDQLEHIQYAGGELLAWRIWRLVRMRQDRSVRLCSIATDSVWPGPVMEADRQPSVTAGDRHGIYAVKPSAGFRRVSHPELDRTLSFVWGWVALSGRVVEHDFGYRAERAAIRRLRLGARAYVAFRTGSKLGALQRELEQRYQCTVIARASEERLARTGKAFAVDSRLVTLPPPVRGPRPKDPHTESLTRANSRRIHRRAMRRLQEQIERWRRLGHTVRVAVKPYWGGSHVRAYFHWDGWIVRMFYHTGVNRWRRA
jgi:hypothetical protein